MKSIVRVSLVAMFMLGIVLVTQAKVTVVPTKHKHLLVLKSDKKYAGATVEVYYSNVDLVTIQKLKKRKMIINFCDAKYGEYTIRVVKGDVKKEFTFIKK